ALTIFCIWFGIKFNAARRQAEAVAAILKTGGTIYYDYQVTPQPVTATELFTINPNAEPNAPRWLRTMFGDDLFRTVVVVNLNYGADGDDSAFRKLSNLSSVRELTVNGVPASQKIAPFIPTQAISDADFAEIGKLEKLELLRLYFVIIRGDQF